MVRLSVADQYLCPLKLDPSWMESGGLLWNIYSYKRIKDGITIPILTSPSALTRRLRREGAGLPVGIARSALSVSAVKP